MKVIQIKFNGKGLFYKGKPFHFEGQASFATLCNMLELANKANHLNKEISLELIPHSVKFFDESFHCDWNNVLSFGLEGDN